MSLVYTNLDLWIEPSGASSYRVRAAHDEKGSEASIIFEKPFSDEDLEKFLKFESGSVRDLRPRPSDSRGLAEKIGHQLYDAIFSRDVLQVMAVAMAAISEEVGLRLRLRLEGDAVAWPWELLHDGKDFLALSIKTPIVRCPKDSKPLHPLKVTLPLRVLVVTSNPSEYERLAVEQEWKDIQGALGGDKHIEIQRLNAPTLRSLGDRLKRGRFHVLHFIGHGRFNRQAKQGVIVVQDEQGAAAFIDGDTLGGLLRGRETRLVVLNACEGGCCSAEGSGLAQRLIDLGVPAVIAMQDVMDDQSAVTFAQHLYESLESGDPVDRAMSEARHGINVANQNQGVDWSTPVLFLRSPDGHLFDVAPHPASPTRNGKVLGVLVLLLVLFLAALTIWRIPRRLLPQGGSSSCPSPRALPDLDFVQVPGGTMKDFCLSVFEVTQEQWTEVMGPNTVLSDILGDDLPVTKVSYEDAQEFFAKLNEKEGKAVFRMPTEAEWELAAKAPGGGWNCRGGTDDDHFDGLAEVGSLEPNQLGLYDMLGNAWEWVVADPQDPSIKDKRVRRGGSYDSTDSCRADRRSLIDPTRSRNDTGIRVLREISK